MNGPLHEPKEGPSTIYQATEQTILSFTTAKDVPTKSKTGRLTFLNGVLDFFENMFATTSSKADKTITKLADLETKIALLQTVIPKAAIAKDASSKSTIQEQFEQTAKNLDEIKKNIGFIKESIQVTKDSIKKVGTEKEKKAEKKKLEEMVKNSSEFLKFYRDHSLNKEQVVRNVARNSIPELEKSINFLQTAQKSQLLARVKQFESQLGALKVEDIKKEMTSLEGELHDLLDKQQLQHEINQNLTEAVKNKLSDYMLSSKEKAHSHETLSDLFPQNFIPDLVEQLKKDPSAQAKLDSLKDRKEVPAIVSKIIEDKKNAILKAIRDYLKTEIANTHQTLQRQFEDELKEIPQEIVERHGVEGEKEKLEKKVQEIENHIDTSDQRLDIEHAQIQSLKDVKPKELIYRRLNHGLEDKWNDLKKEIREKYKDLKLSPTFSNEVLKRFLGENYLAKKFEVQDLKGYNEQWKEIEEIEKSFQAAKPEDIAKPIALKQALEKYESVNRAIEKEAGKDEAFREAFKRDLDEKLKLTKESTLENKSLEELNTVLKELNNYSVGTRGLFVQGAFKKIEYEEKLTREQARLEKHLEEQLANDEELKSFVMNEFNKDFNPLKERLNDSGAYAFEMIDKAIEKWDHFSIDEYRQKLEKQRPTKEEVSPEAEPVNTSQEPLVTKEPFADRVKQQKINLNNFVRRLKEFSLENLPLKEKAQNLLKELDTVDEQAFAEKMKAFEKVTIDGLSEEAAKKEEQILEDQLASLIGWMDKDESADKALKTFQDALVSARIKPKKTVPELLKANKDLISQKTLQSYAFHSPEAEQARQNYLKETATLAREQFGPKMYPKMNQWQENLRLQQFTSTSEARKGKSGEELRQFDASIKNITDRLLKAEIEEKKRAYRTALISYEDAMAANRPEAALKALDDFVKTLG